MTMVEVDPKLFIKCRLCLEDSGTYQIVPSVRDQINYCFEINVEPFDGLPQLLCKKCHSILSDFWEIKKSFIEKQDALKKQTLVNNALPNTEEDQRTPAVKRENSNELFTYGNKRRKTSVSSSHLENNRESNNIPPTKVEYKNQEWVKNYQKTFSCRMCNSQWVSKKSALNHKGNHNILKGKYADIFRRYCVVKLQRFDNKPNLTGSDNQVVYSKSKIISKGNSDYYVSYKYTRENSNSDSDNESNKNGDNCISDDSSDTSSRVNELRIRRRNRRRRICSRSSNETVVLENNPNGKPEDTDCINIDDTDSDDDKHKQVKVNNKNISNAKINAVNKLITATYNKYLKRNEKPEKPSIEQQNRKIISIGRQIINKRGFNCTRLLKYMEYSNLNVIWLTRQPTNVTYNTNFYKIIPRYRYATEKNLNEFEGYKKLYDKPIENRKETPTITTIQRADSVNARQETGSIVASNVVGTTQSMGCQLFSDTTLQPTITNGRTGSNITPDFKNAYFETTKLLNANPVANPRKLPKKFISETKKDKTKKDKAKSEASLPILDSHEVAELTSSAFVDNFKMPIITFTTSLALEASKKESTENLGDETGCNSNNEAPKSAPKIKLRNVAELMSEETLSRMEKLKSVEQTQQLKIPQNDAHLVSNGGNGIQNTMPPNQNHLSVSSGDNCDDYVILDTIDFPNTKTRSPFQYFRTLLQVHNLTLLETDSILTVDFNTLIKFKVLYKQETKEEPVILCLSLFCADKQFCLKIKDRNEININMSKISANWQWEILKIYRGDVVTKVLHNAQKISQEVYDNTNSFLCLLKSINFIAT